MRVVLLLAPALLLAACNQEQKVYTSDDAALKAGPGMGTTTQESVSGGEMAGGDALGSTAPAGTSGQYGNFSGQAGGGDAVADTAPGGVAGATSGQSTTGMSGPSGVAGGTMGKAGATTTASDNRGGTQQ